MLDELRVACRRLGKAPPFTAVAVVTLALAIGANTAIFTGADAVLFKPLPHADPQNAYVLATVDAETGTRSRAVRAEYLRAINDSHRDLGEVGLRNPTTFSSLPTGGETVSMETLASPGVTREQAQAEIDTLVAGFLQGRHDLVVLDDPRAVLFPAGRPVMQFLVAAAALVLLIGCANLASILLVRTLRREREIGLHLALGATRFRSTFFPNPGYANNFVFKALPRRWGVDLNYRF